MLYRFIAYLRFLGTSTNHHGVHSPFIYRFVTQCLYTKLDKNFSKTCKVLLKSIAYFKPTHIFIDTNAMELSKKIIHDYPSIKIGKSPYDLVYFSNPKELLLHETIHGPHIHNGTMILIDRLHHTKETSASWKEIKEWNAVKVSIDMFYCGAVFIRQDQAKEHFKIRI